METRPTKPPTALDAKLLACARRIVASRTLADTRPPPMGRLCALLEEGANPNAGKICFLGLSLSMPALTQKLLDAGAVPRQSTILALPKQFYRLDKASSSRDKQLRARSPGSDTGSARRWHSKRCARLLTHTASGNCRAGEAVPLLAPALKETWMSTTPRRGEGLVLEHPGQKNVLFF
jgi:hypothetical protein